MQGIVAHVKSNASRDRYVKTPSVSVRPGSLSALASVLTSPLLQTIADHATNLAEKVNFVQAVDA